MVKTSIYALILRTNYDTIFIFLRTLKNKLRITEFTHSIKNKKHEQNKLIAYYCWRDELGNLGQKTQYQRNGKHDQCVFRK